MRLEADGGFKRPLMTSPGGFWVMAIVEIKIDAIESFADGQAFSEAGSYLRIKGIAKGEIDPAAPENSVIADLDKAPRNAHGMVEYAADFFILRPAEPRRASGVLVYDVANRGRKMILNLLDDASGNADTNKRKTAQDMGLGLTLGRGYSLVWSGWDSGAPRANNGMTARLPPALENGEPMVRRIRDEFHIGTRAPGKGDVVRLNYPAVSTDQRDARLTVRSRERQLYRNPGGILGVCEPAIDPTAPSRHSFCTVQDLRPLV